MANTYFRIYLHLVFAVKNRESILDADARQKVFPYLSAILERQGHKSLAVGGTANHVHILISYNPIEKLADTLHELKASSSKFINDNRLTKFRFNWQRGYAAFSYSQSQIDAVIQYIMRQEEHHQKTTFRDEMLQIFDNYKVEYSGEYLFDDV